MSKNPCEFEKFCMPEENHQCADREHPGDCDNYHFAVRVHNQAIKTVRVELSKLPIWDDDILWFKVDEKLRALKKASE